MTDISPFNSRTARLSCSAEEFYYFVTDIRNFRQFIPPDKFSDLQMDQDSCSFQAGMLGTVSLRITEKTMYNKVVYTGNALQVREFFLIIDIKDAGEQKTEVNVTLQAQMNSMLKLVAAEPVKRFLETLIDEMEKFKGWRDTKERNQSL